jgi:hypothetical protein
MDARRTRRLVELQRRVKNALSALRSVERALEAELGEKELDADLFAEICERTRRALQEADERRGARRKPANDKPKPGGAGA